MATSNKAIPMVLIGVAALAVVAYFGMSYPPSGDDVVGTVAPAERYRADQPDADDVLLGDQALQQFMQSDTFTTLANDEAFQNALNSEGFRNALNSEGFRNAMNSAGFRNALNGEGFRNALNSQGFRNALNSVSFRNALNSEGFRNALNSEAP